MAFEPPQLDLFPITLHARLTPQQVLDVIEPFVPEIWARADAAFAAERAGAATIARHGFALPTRQSRGNFTELLRQAVVASVPGSRGHTKPNLIVMGDGLFFLRCRALLDTGLPWCSQSPASCEETHQLSELPLVNLCYRLTAAFGAVARLVLMFPRTERDLHWEVDLSRGSAAANSATPSASPPDGGGGGESTFVVKPPSARDTKRTSDTE